MPQSTIASSDSGDDGTFPLTEGRRLDASLRLFPGSQFYFRDHQAPVLRALAGELTTRVEEAA